MDQPFQGAASHQTLNAERRGHVNPCGAGGTDEEHRSDVDRGHRRGVATAGKANGAELAQSDQQKGREAPSQRHLREIAHALPQHERGSHRQNEKEKRSVGRGDGAFASHASVQGDSERGGE
jgi:hypothetical protein